MSQTIGHGSKFQIGDGATPEVFADIAGVTSIDFGSNKVDTPDNTDMATTGNKRTFIAGLEDSGDITVKVNVKPGDTSQALLFSKKDGASHNMKVIYPGDVRTRAFAGIITSVDESVPDDKIPTYTAKIKITGAITNS